MKTSSYDEPYEEDVISDVISDVTSAVSSVSTSQYESHESLFAKVSAQYYHSSESLPVENVPSPVVNEPLIQDLPPTVQNILTTVQNVSPPVQSVSPPVQSVSPPVQNVPLLVQNVPPLVQTQTPLVQSVSVAPPVQNVPPPPVQNVPPPVPKRLILHNDTTNEIMVVTPIETPYDSSEVSVDIQSGYRDIELISPEDIIVQRVEAYGTERWSDTSVSLPGQIEDIETVASDTEQGNAQCEPISEMYYTASSEVSLLSDTELVDKVQNDDEEKDDRKNVIAGHVAAMRERFESMTRTNTPCPDLIRSLSPSLEVFRNTSPSPDRLA